MKNFILALVALFLFAGTTLGQAYRCPGCGKIHSGKARVHVQSVQRPQAYRATRTANPSQTAVIVHQSGRFGAQAAVKAMKMAANNFKGHAGGPIPCAAEGCGWSSVSANHSIRKCCYSGDPIQSSSGPYTRRTGTAVAYNPQTRLYYATIFVDR